MAVKREISRNDCRADRTALELLADSVGARIQRLREVPEGEWRSFRDALAACDDQLGTGLKRLELADGRRVFSHWRQLGASPGRMTCERPNIQRVPRDARCRACFVA